MTLVTLLQMADELCYVGSHDERRAAVMRLLRDADLDDHLVASWASTPAVPEKVARQAAAFADQRLRRQQEAAADDRRRQAAQLEREAAAREAAWPGGQETDTREGADAWEATLRRYQERRRPAAREVT